ncbi:hypothetical protein, partial [Pseudomonas sp. N8]|uniref:hypothetical protein n=1 Tax=Pseudomonas sp. N8 TaxID=3449428 RepID=UPI003F6993A3
MTASDGVGEVESAHPLSELFIHDIASYLIVARGFIPVGLRSDPKTRHRGMSGNMNEGALRPAGINPLATKVIGCGV